MGVGLECVEERKDSFFYYWKEGGGSRGVELRLAAVAVETAYVDVLHGFPLRVVDGRPGGGALHGQEGAREQTLHLLQAPALGLRRMRASRMAPANARHAYIQNVPAKKREKT